MTKVLISKHAEDLGGGPPVEPGQEIPKYADPEALKRLEDRGLVRDVKVKSTAKESS